MTGSDKFRWAINLVKYNRGRHYYYRYIKRNKRKTVAICPFDGLGDSYILYRNMGGFDKKDTTMVVVGAANKKVCELFGYEKVISLKSQAVMHELCFYLILHPHSNCYLLHYDPFGLLFNPVSPIGLLCNIRGINNTTYDDMINKYVLKDFKHYVDHPSFNCNSIAFKKCCELMIKKKTIIIAPRASSMITMPDSVWIQLVRRLSGLGFKVFTNVIKKSDKAICGTDPISFPIDVSVPIMDYAGYFIGVRSGFCDIISTSCCHKYILYQPVIWGTVTNIEYFGLQKMGYCQDNIFEVEIDMSCYIKTVDMLVNKIKEDYLNDS